MSKRSLIFSTLTFAAVLFIVYEDSVISSNRIEGQIKSTINHISMRSIHEEVEKDMSYMNGKNNPIGGPLKPPISVTQEERIAWLRQKLPEFDIFKSDDLTRRFHRRVLQFFNQSCEIQAFMTWISEKSFSKREVLCLETFFKSHPNGCLIILSRTMDTKHGNRELKPLKDRNFKVSAITPDLSFLFHNTPGETWFDSIRSGNRDPGEIPLAQNLSNLIRLAVLYKYGGVYLDTDVIVLKPFTGLRNSIGAQSIDVDSQNWTRLNNAVLIFDAHHPILLKFMQEFSDTFDGNKWGHNGPYLVSRVVRREEIQNGLRNITILPPGAFYPVHWNGIGGWFRSPGSESGLRWTKAKVKQLGGSCYGVHLWNKQSSGLKIENGSVIDRLVSVRHVIV